MMRRFSFYVFFRLLRRLPIETMGVYGGPMSQDKKSESLSLKFHRFSSRKNGVVNKKSLPLNIVIYWLNILIDAFFGYPVFLFYFFQISQIKVNRTAFRDIMSVH